MKKTLIALMALGTYAMGVDAPTTGTELKTSDINAYVIAQGSSYTEWLTGPATLKIDEEKADGTATGGLIISGTSFNSEKTWMDTQSQTMKARTEITFAITLDLSLLNTPSGHTPLIVVDGPSYDTGLGIDGGRKLTGLWNNAANYTTGTALATTGTVTITFSFSNDGTSIYVGDQHLGYKDGLKGDLGGDVSAIVLKKEIVDAMTVFTVYDIASDQDTTFAKSAAAINATIPEPTTATLSLLALCGLAARRRRK